MILTTCLLLSTAVAPQPREEALRLEPVAQLTPSSDLYETGGARLACVSPLGLVVLDLETGRVLWEEPEEGPRATAWALESSGEALWRAEGSELVRTSLADGVETHRWSTPDLIGGETAGPMDDLAVTDQFVAWHARDETAGYLDRTSGQALQTWEGVDSVAFGRLDHRFVSFDPSGRFLLLYCSGSGWVRSIGNDPGGLLIWDTTTNQETRRLRPYVTRSTPGYAFTAQGIVYGHRQDGYRIDHLSLVDGEIHSVDENARKGHFLDLHVSPSGRWVTEGDREKNGLRILDRTGESEPGLLRTSPRRGDRDRFVGFLARPDGAEYVLTTSPDEALTGWSLDGGQRVLLVGAPRRPARSALSALGGNRLIVHHPAHPRDRDVPDSPVAPATLVIYRVDAMSD